MASVARLAGRLLEWLHDPAKPVPFRARPIQPIGSSGNGFTWAQWLVDDQREASGRPDVAVFTSDVLMVPTKIRGEPIANLLASTSGSDSDWVVKLILGWRKSDERRPRSGTLGYLFGMKGRHKASGSSSALTGLGSFFWAR